MKKAALISAAIFAAYFLTRQNMKSDIALALANKNVQAFIDTVGYFESAGDYYALYGGGRFSDDSSHPNIRVPFHNPLRSGAGVNDFSTAAGKYQINRPTWLQIQALALLPDFSPVSQDQAAVWLLKMRGVLPLVIDGDIEGALRKASDTWASLPFSTAGQRPVKLQSALTRYAYNGGLTA